MANQGKDPENPVFIIRGNVRGQDESDVDVTIEIPSLTGKNPEDISKTEMDNIAKAIVQGVKSACTPIASSKRKIQIAGMEASQTPIASLRTQNQMAGMEYQTPIANLGTQNRMASMEAQTQIASMEYQTPIARLETHNQIHVAGIESKESTETQTAIASIETQTPIASMETQTPIALGDYDDGDDEVGLDMEKNVKEIEITDPVVIQNIIKYGKQKYKERKRLDQPEKKLYACKYCDKLFGRTSDCTRHEQTKCSLRVGKEGLVEISATESETGKLQVTQKEVKGTGEVGAGLETSDGQAWADILNEAYDVDMDIPGNTSKPSVKAYYQCPKCPKKLKGSSNFYSHYRTVHENYRPFSCDVCKCHFGTRTNFTNHQIAVHTRKCDGCGNYVAETESWAEGVTKHQERNILCGSCNKVVVFISGSKILHPGMRVSKSTKSSPDTGVSKSAKSKSQPGIGELKSAKATMKSYNYKPRNRKTSQKETYACEVCGKLFYKLFDCRRHQQKHADGKNNMCDVCGSQFQHATTLQQHMKIHDESFIPPHCSICDKIFQAKKNFNEHMMRKHGIDMSADKNPLETMEANIDPGVQYVTVTTSEVVGAFGNTVIQM